MGRTRCRVGRLRAGQCQGLGSASGRGCRSGCWLCRRRCGCGTACHLANTLVFGQHLGAIASIRGQIGCANVVFQTAFNRARAADVFLQNCHAHAHIAHRVKRGQIATEMFVLVGVHPGHDLHQTLGTDTALGKRVKARFNGHHSQDQRGINLVLDKGRSGEVYNIGGGTELTNLELTHRLLAAMGVGEEMVERVQDRLGHDLRYSVDITKISDELGYAPQVPFEQGLADTIAWYRANEAWWRPLKG